MVVDEAVLVVAGSVVVVAVVVDDEAAVAVDGAEDDGAPPELPHEASSAAPISAATISRAFRLMRCCSVNAGSDPSP